MINTISDQPATLSRYFLNTTYLMVDQDEGTFTLWQANPSSGSTLIPIMGSAAEAACQNGIDGQTSPNSTTSDSGTSPTNPPQLSGGSIAGITVGCAAAASLIGGAIFLLRRFHTKKAAHRQRGDVTEQYSGKSTYGAQDQQSHQFSSRGYYSSMPKDEQVYELPNSHSGAAEMYGQQEPRVYEMDNSYHR